MISERNAGRDALTAVVVVAVLVAGLVQINIKLPAVGHLGSALVAVVFLYAPVFYAWRRKEELDDYAFRAEPVRRGLVLAGVAIAVIFPLFIVGYFGFYDVACRSETLSHLAPHSSCARFHGLAGLHWPVFTLLAQDPDTTFSPEFCLIQMVVVALPEELFFRGFLLGLLEKRFPPKRRFLGGGVGLALVLSTLAFAVVHFPKGADARDLVTFFPGLWFGWMRSATGSIFASTISHGASNILVRFLELSVLR